MTPSARALHGRCGHKPLPLTSRPRGEPLGPVEDGSSQQQQRVRPGLCAAGAVPGIGCMVD
jgi:hypothetical protein